MNLSTLKILRTFTIIISCIAALLVLYDRINGLEKQTLVILFYIFSIFFLLNSIALIILNKKIQDIQKNDFSKSKGDRRVTYDFIENEILNHSKSNLNTRIEIDSFALQASTLRSVCVSLMSNKSLPRVKIRSLILNGDSIGSSLRAFLEEKKEIKMNSTLENARLSWLDFKQKLSIYSQESSVDIRTFNNNISFYIVRINNKMIIRPYLAERGFLSPYQIIEKDKNEDLFNKYLSYFEKIYSSSIYSEKLTI